jgi:hypothetical protein
VKHFGYRQTKSEFGEERLSLMDDYAAALGLKF